MTQITLAQVEDQTVHIVLGKVIYFVRLWAFREMMYADISHGGERIVSSLRILPNTWIIPFKYMADGGNFRFETNQADKNEYPFYTGFNTKFKLCTYTNNEMVQNG